jgi:arylsulfatase A-like enzyme
VNRPNILWICADQQRADTLGCYGNTWVRTPRLDGLAAEGARFTSAFSQSPMCSPSRAGFLTGRYPRTTRLRQNGQALPPDETLITRTLAASGYSCGLVGKLHLAACDPSVCPDTEPRGDDGYAEFHWAHDPRSEWSGSEYTRWLTQQGVEYRTPVSDVSPYVEDGMPEPLHHTTWCVDRAIEFVERHRDAGAPWLLSLNLFDPHHPFDPPKDYLQRYLERLDDIPLPVPPPDDPPEYLTIESRGAYGMRGLYPFVRMTLHDHRAVRAAYWAMVDLLDRQVGRLLGALDALRLRENTIVVFCSDHGEMLGDHGAYLKGPHFYDACVRVPLIVRWPGVTQAGLVCEDLVELDDLAPTLLEATGLGASPPMQARSFLPVLTGSGDYAPREDVYCEYYNAGEPLEGRRPCGTMLRTKRHKITVYHGTGEGELYDLQADPLETRNLWNRPGETSLKISLLQRLCDRIAFTADPTPARPARW